MTLTDSINTTVTDSQPIDLKTHPEVFLREERKTLTAPRNPAESATQGTIRQTESKLVGFPAIRTSVNPTELALVDFTMPSHKISRLPSLPTIAVEILRVFSDPDAPIQKVAELVQADPAIASKLLKAANSSRFGLRREVADVRQAITLLGKAKITPIVLSFSLATESLESPEHVQYFKSLWLRSFVQASAAEVLGMNFGPAVASECFTVNLLAGIGQLGILKQDSDNYVECLKLSEEGVRTLAEIEVQTYGKTNVGIAAEMMEKAGLPERCIAAVSALEQGADIDFADDEVERLADVTRTAHALARYVCDSDHGVALVVLQETLGELNGISVSAEELATAVNERVSESAALFDIDPNQLPDPEDLLEDAMEQLADFTERLHDNESVPDELLVENGRLKLQVESLVRQTATDALTGVANRAFFDRRLKELCQQCLRRKVPFGVAVVDIDHFKSVNDTYGHQAGDHILQQVAQSLERATRKNETLARYGGEEFAVLLEDVNPEGMEIMGERLRTVVEGLAIEFEGTSIPVTVSIGIACDLPTDDDAGEKIFASADAELYKAKESGRNRVCVAFSGTAASTAELVGTAR